MEPGGAPIRVMVVDDDAAAIGFFRRNLSHQPGILMTPAAGYADAVECAERERPAVVVVDGGWRGRNVIEQLRAAMPRVKVLSVNGLAAAVQVSRVTPGTTDLSVGSGPGHRLAAAVRRLNAGEGPESVTLGLPPTTELVIHFQGIHDLHSSDAVVGFEALMRWGNQGELVAPGSFLPLVEAEGRTTDYDHHAVRSALTQLAAWRHKPGVRAPRWVSVNLSGVNLRRPDLPGWIDRTLRTCELSPSSLVVEFSYDNLAADLTMSSRRLAELRSVGVRTAVDNVVTGPGGLRGVAGLAVDILKVGRDLTHQIGQSAAALENMRALLQATANRKWPCIATGVEDAEQLATLRSIGWQFAQGHALSKPMTPFGCETLLAEPAG